MEPATGGGGPVSSLARLFRGDQDDNGLWEDREIRFDNAPNQMKLRRGENLIDSVNNVEDTKGNNGERGTLIVTNLRIMWFCEKNPRTNLAVGFNCVVSVTMKNTTSRLKGNAQAIYCLTKYNGSRFEFIFTSLLSSGPKLFSTLQTVFRQYDSSRLYRELKLRGNVIQDKELKMLPDEQIYSKISGAWNLSSEQGNLGTFFITSVRLVWFANMAPNFNVSIPYLQMKTVKVRDSKFGQALVIETSVRSGSYILGFKVDPEAKMLEVSKEVQALWQVYTQNPNFGVDVEAVEGAVEAAAKASQALPRVDDDVSIVDAQGAMDVFSSYYADGASLEEREPVFSPDLGLAIEGLQDGVTVEQLWNVL